MSNRSLADFVPATTTTQSVAVRRLSPPEMRALEGAAKLILRWVGTRRAAVDALELAAALGFRLHPRRFWHPEMSAVIPTGGGWSGPKIVAYCDKCSDLEQRAVVAELVAAQVRQLFRIEDLDTRTTDEADRYLARALLLPLRRFARGPHVAARLVPRDMLEQRRIDAEQVGDYSQMRSMGRSVGW